MAPYNVSRIAQRIRESAVVCGATKLITIDGPAGSGKTTLARHLAQELGRCEVIHMDDLYDGWTQDLAKELPQRITTSIIEPLQMGIEPRYLKYDWYQKAFTETICVPECNFLILEGVGSGHSTLRSHVALAIWIESAPQLLVERIVARDGEQLRDELAAWQIKEADYFAKHSVREAADLHVRGDD